MTLRLAAALAAAFHALPSVAQFEGIADLKIVSSEEENALQGTGRLYLSSAAWRMETDLKPSKAASPEMRSALGGADSFRIVAFGKVSEPRKSWMLNERTKTYAVVESDPAERGDRGASAEEWTISRAGKDKVAGFACENVKATRKGEDDTWEACLARDFLSSAWMRLLAEDEEQGWIVAAQRAGVKGYPVRMISRGSDGKEKHRFEVVKVERRKLPASLFEVPAGYRETGVMGTMAQTPEQQRQMEEAQKKMEEAMKEMSPEQKKAMEEMMRQYGGKKP